MKLIKRSVIRYLRKHGYRIEKIPISYQELGNRTMEKIKEVIKTISPDFKVLNGVFKGMQYPSLDITEYTLVPKILGSYEAQLQSIIETIFETPYSDILDVGCAEGYYAVGLASKMPATMVHGYDINEKDLDFCRQLAACNHVQNLTLATFCSPETLMNFDFRSKGLIFCDCEGYELDLFTPQVVSVLKEKNVDVLVELHDVVRPGITSALLQRFKETHDILIVNNRPEKKQKWEGIENLSESDQEFAVLENRGGYYQNVFMEWAFFTVKN